MDMHDSLDWCKKIRTVSFCVQVAVAVISFISLQTMVPT